MLSEHDHCMCHLNPARHVIAPLDKDPSGLSELVVRRIDHLALKHAVRGIERRCARQERAKQYPSTTAPHKLSDAVPADRVFFLIVIFQAQVSDELLTSQVAQGVLELHQLNE